MSTPIEVPFEQILKALLDPDTPFPPTLLYRLSDLGAAEMAELAGMWSSIPAWRRKALMEDIETLGETDFVLSFEAIASFALRDPESSVRLPALRTLWEYDEVRLIPAFLELLDRDSDREVRAAAAIALGQFIYLGELEEIPTSTLREVEDRLLRVITGSDEAPVRRRALEAMGFSSREEMPALILSAYNSGDRAWRASALYAMGRSANERWSQQVLENLESDFPAIRTEAARAAGELEISQAAPLLFDLLEDPDDGVRAASIWSLSQIGGEGVRETLEQFFEEADDEEEADYIEKALDNLAFTEEVQLFSLFDLPEGADLDEEDWDEGEWDDAFDEEE